MSKKKKLRDINHTHLAHYLNKSGTDSLLLKLGREGLTTGGVCVVKCVPLEGNVYYMKQRCRNCSVDDAIKFVKTLIPYPEGRYSNIDYPFVLESLEAIREKLKYSNIPKPLRGLGITMLLTGLIAMAFMTFSGINI